MASQFVETFPALSAIPDLQHGFFLKDPAIDVKTDRDTALARLQEHHDRCLESLGIPKNRLATGQQVHAAHIEACDDERFPGSFHFPDTDGLITKVQGQFLGVYVADCGAVFLVDPVLRACGVVHSGKKGTELQIAPHGIQEMQRLYGSRPEDIIVQLAPCIRPPEYEIDFAAQIRSDCLAAGVPANQVHDCGTCTTSDPDRYYSYRKEKGKTGRLFAVIGWK